MFTSQPMARHLWWWPRGTGEYLRTDGNEHAKKRKKNSLGTCSDCLQSTPDCLPARTKKQNSEENGLLAAEPRVRTVCPEASDCPQANSPKQTGAVFSSIEKCIVEKKRFSVTSNLRYIHGILNVDKIKNYLHSLVILCETNVVSLISQRLDNYYQIQTKWYSVATVNFGTKIWGLFRL
jgi:hypothetical protein